jgi:hypothetical protein
LWTSTIDAATGIAPATKSHRHERWSNDQAGEDDPEAAADTEDRRQQPDPDLDLVRRELVADDAEAQREDGAPCAGERAESDQRADVPGERAADRAEQEDRERNDEHALLAVLVSELAEQRGRDRGRQQEDRQHPGRPGGARVELLLEGRERREDHRLLQSEGRPGHGQDRQRQVVVLPSRRRAHHAYIRPKIHQTSSSSTSIAATSQRKIVRPPFVLGSGCMALGLLLPTQLRDSPFS